MLNFETPAQFFGRLTEKRWHIVRAAQGQGELQVRELARRVGRDVKRVHDDVVALAQLGLLERTERGGVVCPYAGCISTCICKRLDESIGGGTGAAGAGLPERQDLVQGK